MVVLPPPTLPRVDDFVVVLVEIDFEVVGLRRPSSRQIAWLFERHHEAEVIAARVMLRRRDRSFSRTDAEAWLQSDDAAPQIEYVLYENPGKVRKLIAGTLAASALFGSLQRTFNAAEGAIHAADQMVQEAQQLKHDIEELAGEDPNREQAQSMLYGQGQDPGIRVVGIHARPVQ